MADDTWKIPGTHVEPVDRDAVDLDARMSRIVTEAHAMRAEALRVRDQHAERLERFGEEVARIKAAEREVTRRLAARHRETANEVQALRARVRELEATVGVQREQIRVLSGAQEEDADSE